MCLQGLLQGQFYLYIYHYFILYTTILKMSDVLTKLYLYLYCKDVKYNCVKFVIFGGTASFLWRCKSVRIAVSSD
jgi:hypothetical protein